MPRLIFAIAPFLLLAPISLLSAGEFNEVLSVGDKAPSWNDLPGADDKKHSLADLAKKEVLVIIFTYNYKRVAGGK